MTTLFYDRHIWAGIVATITKDSKTAPFWGGVFNAQE